MADILLCSKCGAQNNATLESCSSCGAPLSLDAAESEEQGRYQQLEFRWAWVGVGFLITLLFLGAGTFALPRLGLSKFALFALGLILPFFLGGLLTALISPRKTFIEPALAAVFALLALVSGIFLGLYLRIDHAAGGLAIVDTIRLIWTRESFQPGSGLWSAVFRPLLPTVALVGPIGFLLALLGSWFGEKMQGTTRVRR
jgi:hypothetical protein